MIEGRHRFEMIIGVTFQAVAAKLTTMQIDMATQAGSIQPQVSPREVFVSINGQ